MTFYPRASIHGNQVFKEEKPLRPISQYPTQLPRVQKFEKYAEVPARTEKGSSKLPLMLKLVLSLNDNFFSYFQFEIHFMQVINYYRKCMSKLGWLRKGMLYKNGQ